MASAGPLLAGTGTDGATAGTVTWITPQNITAEDSTFATATLSSQTSHYLRGALFGFAIPGGATINGIVVEWKRKSNTGAITDAAIRIVQNGTFGTTDKSSGTPWSSTLGWYSYGTGTTDLWGLPWSSSDINASNFGAALSATAAGSETAAVDACRITVYYTAAPTAGVPPIMQFQRRFSPAHYE